LNLKLITITFDHVSDIMKLLSMDSPCELNSLVDSLHLRQPFIGSVITFIAPHLNIVTREFSSHGLSIDNNFMMSETWSNVIVISFKFKIYFYTLLIAPSVLSIVYVNAYSRLYRTCYFWIFIAIMGSNITFWFLNLFQKLCYL
jgi:hypothetical protein